MIEDQIRPLPDSEESFTKGYTYESLVTGDHGLQIFSKYRLMMMSLKHTSSYPILLSYFQ